MPVPNDAELEAIANGGTPQSTPSGDKPAAGTGQPAAQAQTPAPVTLKDDDLVEFTVDGEKVVKPYREAREGWQRQEDYTRKTQAVATRLQEVKELYDGLSAKQKELFDKEAAIDAILGRTPRPQSQVPGDDDVVPFGVIKQTVAELLAKERAEFTKAQNEFQQNSTEQRTFERWEEKVTDVVDKLIVDHPVLAKIPGLTASLKRMAKDDNPQTEPEMLQAVAKAGKRVAKDIDDDYAERRKQDDIKRKQLRDKGPEPGGGQTAFKAPDKSYVKGRKIDWDSLEKDVIATIEAMEE